MRSGRGSLAPGPASRSGNGASRCTAPQASSFSSPLLSRWERASSSLTTRSPSPAVCGPRRRYRRRADNRLGVRSRWVHSATGGPGGGRPCRGSAAPACRSWPPFGVQSSRVGGRSDATCQSRVVAVQCPDPYFPAVVERGTVGGRRGSIRSEVSSRPLGRSRDRPRGAAYRPHRVAHLAAGGSKVRQGHRVLRVLVRGSADPGHRDPVDVGRERPLRGRARMMSVPPTRPGGWQWRRQAGIGVDRVQEAWSGAFPVVTVALSPLAAQHPDNHPERPSTACPRVATRSRSWARRSSSAANRGSELAPVADALHADLAMMPTALWPTAALVRSIFELVHMSTPIP